MLKNTLICVLATAALVLSAAAGVSSGSVHGSWWSMLPPLVANLIGAKKMSASKFRMVLTAKGAFAYTRPDGVIVCPIGCLRD